MALTDYGGPSEQTIPRVPQLNLAPQPPPYYLAAPGMPSQPPPETQIVDRQAWWEQQQQQADEARRLADELKRQQEFRLAGVREELARRMAPAAPLLKARDYYNLAGQAAQQEDYNNARVNPPQDAEAVALLSRGDQRGYALYQRAGASGATQRDMDAYQQHVASTQYSQGDYGALDLWRAPIPYADRVANVAGQVGGAIGGALTRGTAIPGEDIGRVIGEGIVPTEVWQLALELAPGIGSVPGIASFFSKTAMPELRLVARQAGMRVEEYMASRAGREALDALLEKRGIKQIAGASGTLGPGDDAAKAAAGAGDAVSPAAASLPSPPEPVTASSGIDSIAKKINTMISSARKLAPEQARMISEQKTARLAKATQRFEQGGGLEGFHEGLSSLADPFAKPTFAGLDLPPEDLRAAVDHIMTMRPTVEDNWQEFGWRKVEALRALEKSVVQKIKPQPRELDSLHMFMPEIRIREAFETQGMAGPIRGFEGETAFPFDTFNGGLQREPLSRSAGIVERSGGKIVAEQPRLTLTPAEDEARRAAQSAVVQEQIQRRIGETKAAYAARVEAARASFRAMQEANLPSSGMQSRLAETINEAFVGAVTAGKATPARMGMLRKLLHESATVVTDIMTLPKALKAGIDIGWGGRNGIRLAPRNPAEWWRMWKKQFTALRSAKWADEMDAETRAFVNFRRSQEMPEPLAYLQPGTGTAETSGEEFTSRITKHIRKTIAGHEVGLAGFERAYVHPGNWFRQAMLDKWVRKQVQRNVRAGLPEHLIAVSDTDFQAMISLLNKATLRGDTRFLERLNGQGLASVLFSLKGVVSGPQFAFEGIRAIAGAGNHSPATRRIIAENFGAYVGMGMGALGLAATTGWALDKNGKPSWVNVDLNHLSPTFGMIEVGGVRWNYWGADQPLVRLAIQLAERKVQRPGTAAVDISGRDAAVKWFGNKWAPGLPSAAWDEAVNKGKTYRSGVFNEAGMNMNSPMGALIYAFNQVSPIPLESAVNAWKDIGPAAVPFALAADVQGFTTSTYDASPTEKQKASAAKQPILKALEADGFQNVLNEEFQNRAKDLSAAFSGADMSKFDSLKEFRDAYVKDWAPVIAEDEDISLHSAELKAAAEVDDNPAIVQLQKDVNVWEDDYWRGHRDLAQQAWDTKAQFMPRADIRKELGIK